MKFYEGRREVLGKIVARSLSLGYFHDFLAF